MIRKEVGSRKGGTPGRAEAIGTEGAALLGGPADQRRGIAISEAHMRIAMPLDIGPKLRKLGVPACVRI